MLGRRLVTRAHREPWPAGFGPANKLLRALVQNRAVNMDHRYPPHVAVGYAKCKRPKSRGRTTCQRTCTPTAYAVSHAASKQALSLVRAGDDSDTAAKTCPRPLLHVSGGSIPDQGAGRWNSPAKPPGSADLVGVVLRAEFELMQLRN